MANLTQISNLRGSQRGAALLAQILTISPFLRWFDGVSGWEEDATSFQYRVRTGSVGVNYRAIGAAYSTTKSLDPSALQNGAIKLGGFQIDIDQTYVADSERGLMDLENWVDDQLAEEGYTFSRSLENELFLGAGTGNTYKGLKNVLDGTTDVTGFTGNKMVINAKTAITSGSPVSLDLTNSANYDAFTEALITWMTQVESPTGLIMSPGMYARMYTIAKKQQLLGQALDQFGVAVDTFNRVPMIQTLDTTILSTEPDDTPTTPLTNTTSIYIMAPGEKMVSLVSNSGLEFEDYDTVPNAQVKRLKAEVRASWKIAKDRKIRRIRNIKI